MGLDASRLVARGGRFAGAPAWYGRLPDRDADDILDEKRRKPLSPLLDQIIHGGPSTTLDVSRITRVLKHGTPLFATAALNRCIIFKYPNFDVELSDDGAATLAGRDPSRVDRRPVETAIYIPHDEELPADGGYAVYIRQKRADELLLRHLGLTTGRPSEPQSGDIRKLMLIDEIPSLDPFLLKTTFDREAIAIDPAYLAIDEREESAIRRVVGDRVRPIVARALGAEGTKDTDRTRRFVRAIWDPSAPEAGLFMEALRIDRSETATVFGAWKGIAFYQCQFARSRVGIAELLKWFKSRDAVPLDAHRNRHFHEQQVMYRAAIHRKILNLLSHVQGVVRDFDDCYVRFVQHSDASPLRMFLLEAQARYWMMGYCCSALAHCRRLFERYVQPARRNRVSFEEMNEMLTRMDEALRSQSDALPLAG